MNVFSLVGKVMACKYFRNKVSYYYLDFREHIDTWRAMELVAKTVGVKLSNECSIMDLLYKATIGYFDISDNGVITDYYYSSALCWIEVFLKNKPVIIRIIAIRDSSGKIKGVLRVAPYIDSFYIPLWTNMVLMGALSFFLFLSGNFSWFGLLGIVVGVLGLNIGAFVYANNRYDSAKRFIKQKFTSVNYLKLV